MSRPLRLWIPRATYHLVSRGNAKQCIFEDDLDYQRFLEHLEMALDRFGAECVAYCLLWNHYHLLVVPKGDGSRMMQHLNSKYCQAFNRRHGRVGHVLQGRFGARVVDDASYMMNALRYIALNPVDAEQAERPDNWEWGSYAAALGIIPAPPFLALHRIWAAFDTDDALEGRERFKTFVAGGGPADDLGMGLLFGGRGLAKRVAPLLEPYQPNEDFVYADRFAARPPLSDLLDPHMTGPRREEAAWDAFFRHAYTLREIGHVFGAPVSTAWSWVQRGKARRLKPQPAGSDLDFPTGKSRSDPRKIEI